MPLRCLIVDDSRSFLEAAGTLLERQGMTVAGVASNAADALLKVRELRPDVVLLDVALGTESGVKIAGRLVSDGSQPVVILVSTNAESDLADVIEESPAAGFISKPDLSAEAIRRLVG